MSLYHSSREKQINILKMSPFWGKSNERAPAVIVNKLLHA